MWVEAGSHLDTESLEMSLKAAAKALLATTAASGGHPSPSTNPRPVQRDESSGRAKAPPPATARGIACPPWPPGRATVRSRTAAGLPEESPRTAAARRDERAAFRSQHRPLVMHRGTANERNREPVALLSAPFRPTGRSSGPSSRARKRGAVRPPSKSSRRNPATRERRTRRPPPAPSGHCRLDAGKRWRQDAAKSSWHWVRRCRPRCVGGGAKVGDNARHPTSSQYRVSVGLTLTFVLCLRLAFASVCLAICALCYRSGGYESASLMFCIVLDKH